MNILCRPPNCHLQVAMQEESVSGSWRKICGVGPGHKKLYKQELSYSPGLDLVIYRVFLLSKVLSGCFFDLSYALKLFSKFCL